VPMLPYRRRSRGYILLAIFSLAKSTYLNDFVAHALRG
jgi:hypothetical protein